MVEGPLLRQGACRGGLNRPKTRPCLTALISCLWHVMMMMTSLVTNMTRGTDADMRVEVGGARGGAVGRQRDRLTQTMRSGGRGQKRRADRMCDR